MLFQLYSDHAVDQIIGWVLVFVGLIVMNEIGRRTKQGGMVVFVIIPTILTVYFILAHLGMFGGENNPTVAYMDGWFHYFKLYAADIHDDQVQMGNRQGKMVQMVPVVHRCS